MKNLKIKKRNFFLSTTNSFYVVFLFLIVVTNLSCNKMDKQKFKVFGEESLLKDCKINIINLTGVKQGIVETLLYKGKIKEISIDDEVGEVYRVYVSYNDSLVTTIKFEDILRNMKNPPDIAFVIQKNDNGFIGIKGTAEGLSILTPIDDYFKKNKIDNEETKNKEKKLFFDYYK